MSKAVAAVVIGARYSLVVKWLAGCLGCVWFWRIHAISFVLLSLSRKLLFQVRRAAQTIFLFDKLIHCQVLEIPYI
jgi:hypothetical protein